MSRRRASGSAFVIALLVLLIVSFLGISLSVITTTERQLAGNDRSTERSYYAAETGLNVGFARVLVANAYEQVGKAEDLALDVLEITDAGPGGDRTPTTQSYAELSPAVPLAFGPCAFCEVNSMGEYGSKSYLRAHIGLTSYGYRGGPPDASGNRTATAQRVLSATLDTQPWQLPTTALFPLENKKGSLKTYRP